ncbi:von Willebrand factor type A [Catenulispora acidiphila DSM 44928]|uniref:von Willebrand factor type A n=1 Tax=Catenulispora acidiphila (strain DSM 44928 / JCM 14897 / NBRC 102108 / NRRL B-24433 / ID139908) TaxID=479433 RepID=C7PZX1_CATAD|nr:substrate-binding and VWA domain-containing protein [Catenulispora acidiphila]ACU73636.1 von Willebrand factor type A [Catenulispora acidiphila DSM 44928]
MAGRHRSYEGPGNTPRGRGGGSGGSSFPTGLVAIGAVLVLAAGGGYVYYTKKHDTTATAGNSGTSSAANGSCAAPTTLNVDANPDVYTAVKAVADGMADPCVHVNVSSAEASAVEAFLAGSAKGGDVTSAPDVWIPDSSMWIDIAHTGGVKSLAANPAPVATSPLVIGMPKPVAAAAGWPAKPFGWADLLANFKTTKLQTAVPDPTTSGPGLAAITMLRAAVLGPAGTDKAKQSQALQNLTLVYRVMSTSVSSSMSALLTGLPTQGATAAGAGGIAAFPSTEQKIAAYNTASPATPLVALYPSDMGTMMMDYPYTISSTLDAAHAKAAADFQTLLHSPAAVNTLQKAGFRDPKGAAAGILTSANGVNPAVPALAPADTTHTAAGSALSVWKVTSEQTRGLVVMDVSGSMGLTVDGQVDPNTHTPLSRLQITAAACLTGLPLFGDSSQLGLWTFTTKNTADGGGTVHKELVPMGPLSAPVGAFPSRRAALNAALGQLSIQPGSRNGLYDTILDAYQTVLTGWAPNESNAIVVFTDGKDDGLNSMSADQLITKLNALKAANPNHPVRVMIVALGSGVDLTTLSKITGAANGQALHADTPADIGSAVIAGFAGRLSDQ